LGHINKVHNIIDLKTQVLGFENEIAFLVLHWYCYSLPNGHMSQTDWMLCWPVWSKTIIIQRRIVHTRFMVSCKRRSVTLFGFTHPLRRPPSPETTLIMQSVQKLQKYFKFAMALHRMALSGDTSFIASCCDQDGGILT